MISAASAAGKSVLAQRSLFGVKSRVHDPRICVTIELDPRFCVAIELDPRFYDPMRVGILPV
jgi:hypothetical protein